jgi:ubiquitin thioesterase protein OTUB1
MSSLRSEYENGSVTFLDQIDWLIANGYGSIRRTRGEAPFHLTEMTATEPQIAKQVMGTAFIDVRGFSYHLCIPTLTPQALGFAYVEGLLRSTDQEIAVAKSLSFLSSTNETLHDAGIEKLVYEDFYTEFASLIENIINPNIEGVRLTVDLLLNAFQNPEGGFIVFSLYSSAHTLIPLQCPILS